MLTDVKPFKQTKFRVEGSISGPGYPLSKALIHDKNEQTSFGGPRSEGQLNAFPVQGKDGGRPAIQYVYRVCTAVPALRLCYQLLG